MRKTTVTFSNNAIPLDALIDIQVSKPLGLMASVFIQEKARTLSQYDQSIKCDASGQDDKGKKIAIDTVGRWLFGVPGYSGHIRVVPADDRILLYYPKNSPKVVHELLSSLKEMIEINK